MTDGPPNQDRGEARSSKRALSPLRTLAFALVAVLGLLVLANVVVEWAESRSLLNTHRPDDVVQFLDEQVYERDGEWYRTSKYARTDILDSRFPVEKGDAWRMFLVGGSFAMGVPYTDSRRPENERDGMSPTPIDGGGIASWVRVQLATMYPDSPIEVINAGASGQNSRRVREIALEVLKLDPDVLLIATGNNEGNLDPGLLRSQLQEQGGYRLLRKLLRPPPAKDAGSRSRFTFQDPATQLIRSQYRGHIQDILTAAAKVDVPVLLATLPTNLLYLGFEPGRGGPEKGWPFQAGPCLTGVGRFDAGDYRGSLPLLLNCLEGPKSEQPPPIRSYYALAGLESGTVEPGPSPDLAADLGPCIESGIRLYYSNQAQAAIEQLRSCDEVGAALFWIGRSRLKLGEADLARHALYKSVELVPRNRTRPSYNRIVREEAASFDGVHTLDLARAAEAVSPDGIPGHGLFLDYCHMHWRGYAQMADEVLSSLDHNGLGPSSRKLDQPPVDSNELASMWRLPALPTSAGLKPDRPASSRQDDQQRTPLSETR